MYDPQVGRFLQRDTLGGSAGASQTQNRYSYVENNPTTLVDPSGHVAFVPLLVAAWGAYEIGASVLDAIATVQTLADPHASFKEKVGSTGLFFLGLGTPGGGWSAGARVLRHGDGAFSIPKWMWNTYPTGAKRPDPNAWYQLVSGSAYNAARDAADNMNAAIRRVARKVVPHLVHHKQVHETHPVKFRGDPKNWKNKELLDTKVHDRVTTWWKGIQSYVERYG